MNNYDLTDKKQVRYLNRSKRKRDKTYKISSHNYEKSFRWNEDSKVIIDLIKAKNLESALQKFYNKYGLTGFPLDYFTPYYSKHQRRSYKRDCIRKTRRMLKMNNDFLHNSILPYRKLRELRYNVD